MLTLFGASLLALAPVALAQQIVWGQCGGIGWTGPTTCVSENECIKQNDWYSQCLPSTATPSSSSSTVVSSSSTTSSSSIPQPTGANYWFSFGDSYTQTGFDPYGTLPSADNPIGNPTFPGWTSTGGVNWVGAGTTTFNKSHILTYNYAYGGATIDSDLVTPYQPTVISLTEQVDQYLATAGTKPPSTPWTGSNSLFSIWIGINDIGNSFWLEGRDAFSDTLLNAEFALVQKLYGARNFLFVNVPPINGPRTRRELLSRPSMQSSRHKQPHSKLATLGLRLTFGTRMLRSRGFGLANLVWICGRHHFRCRVWHILGR